MNGSSCIYRTVAHPWYTTAYQHLIRGRRPQFPPTRTMTVEICKPIRDDLAECVLRSNCVLRQERTVQDCIKNPQDLPEQCRHLMTSFSNCKRGLVSRSIGLSACSEVFFNADLSFLQLDMRKRFRGIGNIAKPSSADPVSDVSL